MRISTFPSLTDPRPSTIETDLASLAAAWIPLELARKEDAPCWSPWEFSPGATRGADSSERCHAVVLDLDGASEGDLARVVIPAIEGRAYLAHTTWRDALEVASTGRRRLRIVLPLGRPVAGDEWPRVWEAAATRLGGGIAPRPGRPDKETGLVDRSCRDVGHVYYVPSCPVGAGEGAFVTRKTGRLTDPDELMRLGPAPGPAPTAAALTQHGKRLARRRSEAQQDLGERLQRLARGEAIAGPGERDEVLWRVACELARAFGWAGELVLGEVVRPSLEAMAREAGGAPDGATAVDKIRRALDEVERRAREEQREEDRERRSLLRAAGRETVYTDEEVDRLAAAAGATDEIDLSRRWVLQRDGAYYLLALRGEEPTYLGPYTHREVSPAAEARLAAAESAGVRAWETERGRRRAKTAARLVSDYGQVVERVVVDLAAEATHFDGRALVRAPCPPRRIEPARSETVERWLEELAGEQTDRLLDWIAVVTDLRHPCAALYLHGAKGTGKSLLADGLARIWTEGGPTPLEDVLGSWTDRLLTCPLVFADERAPEDHRGVVRTAELRAFVAARARTLKRKFLPDDEVRGCVRLVLAANNQDLLASAGDLTPEDVQAIAERLLYVRVRPEAAAYLAGLEPSRIEALVAGDEVAAHALWLRGTRRVARGSRFLVAGDRDELVTRLTVGHGLRSAVLNWIALWLAEPAKLAGQDLVRVSPEGEIQVSERGLQSHWTLYETNWRPPTASQLAAALSAVCYEGAQRRARSAGRRAVRYRVVDPELLRAWCGITGYDAEDLFQSVEELAEETRRAEARAAG